MSTGDDLTPPGSTVYSSDTMFVGDGTWDRTSNTFLLPNLQGLNFDTMRINGMGNRFRAQPLYTTIIRVHGVLAAIVFLFLIPFAIFYVRFGRQPRWGVRMHIWCQILTLLLSTALFALPFFAVGPIRSLTNPHHGIGVALYVLIVVQFFWGWLVYKRERRRKLAYAPVKAVLHRWFGRLIALLGLAQIPLGLTLYGSPLVLFILYALVVFGWLLTYFVLGYIDEKNQGREITSEYSWASGSGSHVAGRRHGRFGKFAKGAAAAGGIGYLAHKLRNRDEAVASRPNSGSLVEDEKMSEHGSQHQGGGGGGLGKKLLAGGILAGIGYKLFGGGKKKHDDNATVTSYDYTESEDSHRHHNEGASPPHGGSTAPLNRPTSSHHHQHSHAHTHSTATYSEDEYSSASPSRRDRRSHGFRDALLGAGAFGIARNLFKKRRERKEQQRIDQMRQQDIDEERIVREGSRRKKYTGDGYPRPRPPLAGASVTSTNLTPIPPGGATASGAVPPPSNLSTYQPPTIDGQPLPVVPPPPHGGPPPQSTTINNNNNLVHQLPTHDDVFSSSAAQAHLGGPQYPPPPPGGANPMIPPATTAMAGFAAGAAAAAATGGARDRSTSSRRNRRQSTGTPQGGPAANSPPVSVKLNMHADGRHVTLRRLTEEEAAADRARRAAAAGGGGIRPVGASGSSIEGMGGPGMGGQGGGMGMGMGGGGMGGVYANDPAAAGSSRFRRGNGEDAVKAERAALQSAQAQLNASSQQGLLNPQQQQQQQQQQQPPLAMPMPAMPPPPPIHGSETHPPGSVTSPGGTVSNAGSNYERNRRRRRAERAQAQAMQGRRGAGEFD